VIVAAKKTAKKKAKTVKKAVKKAPKAASKKAEPGLLPSGRKLMINGEQAKPGKKVKLEEHLGPAQIEEMVRAKAAQKGAGDADDDVP
jgi:hypothetical protein